jgi:hypothetical protein
MMEIKIVSIERVHGEDKFKKPCITHMIVNYQSSGVNATQRVVPFANPSVYKALDNAEVGESFDVAVTKNAKGYDVWSTIGAVGTIKPTTASGATKVIGSNYETAEERAVKQRYIVRQSSLANAIAYYNSSLDKPHLDVEQILDIARQFEEFVFEPVKTLQLD